jgi:hypothetical protein
MRFKIKTLVDITETNAPRGTDSLLVKQQQNFNSFYNVIGLRTNPINFVVTVEEEDTSKFGSIYKGKQKVWTAEFEVEAEDSTSVEIMENDFDLVPVLDNLTETVKEQKMFITHSNPKKTNIILKRLDK